MRHGQDAPATLFDDRRLLSREECRQLSERVFEMARGGGVTVIRLVSAWNGTVRWGRNRVSMAGDQRDNVEAWVYRIRDARGSATRTNQIDDASLESAVRNSERLLELRGGSRVAEDGRFPDRPYSSPTIWSDATFDTNAATRGEVVRNLIAPAEAAGMLSAGYLATAARSTALAGSHGVDLFALSTDAQCSMTVRDQKGLGSGWAGASSYDWGALDLPAVAAVALDKCRRSLNPVVIEPGRYTVILEPQAVCDLLTLVMESLKRMAAEGGKGPFAADTGFSKLGRKVMDDRVTISHDPTDPLLGVLPFDLDEGEPYRAVKWIENGTLSALDYRRDDYALPRLNQNDGLPNSGAFRMSGGQTTVEEMIRTTQRGLLVTRFSNVSLLDPNSLLATGVTRDGLWLIERGEISKAVRNLRFTESPMFVLNNIDQLGTPVPVFRPGKPAIVPPIKARDFSFTSLVDAI
ncbi:MAG: metallopeptidase TldD-related protein [Gemmatimonadaceae bacterium]